MNGPAEMVRVSTDVWPAARGGGWLAVEGPLANRGELPPLYRDAQHTLLRPYEGLLQGDPNVGFVQYGFGTLFGKDPRVLYATSLRYKRKGAPSAIMPMDLTIHPGFSMRQFMQGRDGSGGHMHHISVRETPEGLQVYAHLRTAAGGKHRQRIGRRLTPRTDLGGLIMLATSYLKDWKSLDASGLAVAHMPEGAFNRCRTAGTLSNYPPVVEHALMDINGPPDLMAVQNYLWQGFFLGQKVLSDADLKDLFYFFGRNLQKHLRHVNANPGYDGSFRGRLISVPLGLAGPDAPWKYLHVTTAVMPGGIQHNVSLAAFAEHLPILSSDLAGKEDLYQTYALEHYPRLRQPSSVNNLHKPSGT
jgi:hypothetical protein